MIATFRTLRNITTWDELNDQTIATQQFQLYMKNRTGLYSATASTVAFIPWASFMDPEVIKDIKAQLDTELNSDPRFNRSTYALQRSWIDEQSVPQLEIILFPGNSVTIKYIFP